MKNLENLEVAVTHIMKSLCYYVSSRDVSCFHHSQNLTSPNIGDKFASYTRRKTDTPTEIHQQGEFRRCRT